MDKPDPKLNE